MRHPALLLTLLCLAGAAHAADDEALWKAVFQLDEPENAKSAAALLRSKGAAGYDVLSKVAHAGSERMALGVAAKQIGCYMFGAMHMDPHSWTEPPPSLSAAKLAAEMLLEDKALREATLGSDVAFNRAFALLVSAGVPGAMPGALKRLENEKEPRVLSVVEGASRCAKMRTGDEVDAEAERLSRRLDGTVQQPRCDQPGAVEGAFVDGVAKGTYAIAGWGQSGDDFTINIQRGTTRLSSLAPTCAMDLYDALVKRGNYEPGLVVPVAAQRLLPLNVRDAAARRAVRDLPKFPEANRNKLAAELVLGGYKVPVKVTYRTDTFAQETELEAAARQGDPRALEEIDRFVFCRGSFGSNGLSMLGYLKTPDAAETAYQLAERCPHALVAGTAALLRLKDPRGLQLLGKALKEQSFAQQDLYRAALESYTPALGREVREMAAAEDASFPAKDLLKILKLAGVMRD